MPPKQPLSFEKVSRSHMPIIDLHCDLLGCVEWKEGEIDFDSPDTNCSIPQLLEGQVKLQVLAIAAMGQKNASLSGRRQVELYQELLQSHTSQVGAFKDFSLTSPKTHFLLAIENASALIEEEEKLDLFFERFE